jgi:hypothetical protein
MMSLLVVSWLLSFATLCGVVFYARSRTVDVLSSADDSTNWRDFIAVELTRIVGYVSHLLSYARPHGARALFHGSEALKKGHDLFIEKVFGGIEIEKGKAASFFLKRIIEHKESLREKDRGRL